MSLCVGCHFDPCRCVNERSVIITREEADKAVIDGFGPYAHLRERFIEQHGLTFDNQQFFDKAKFRWMEDRLGRAFKVVYKAMRRVFQPGDAVLCVAKRSCANPAKASRITIGKVYKVVSVCGRDDDTIRVRNDLGKSAAYSGKFFKFTVEDEAVHRLTPLGRTLDWTPVETEFLKELRAL